MTFETETEADSHAIGWYIEFDGIATKFATEDFSLAPWSISGTFEKCLVSISGDGEELDQASSIVLPGDFSVSVQNTATVLSTLRRSGGTETVLLQSASATTPGLTLEDQTLAGTTIFVDRETITLGTHFGGGTYTGCTRAVDGSIGQAHQAYAVASTVPRHWLERRAKLYQVYLDTGTSTIDKVGIMTRSPQFENGVWALSFTDFLTVLNRPLLSGFNPAEVSSENITSGEAAFSILIPGLQDYFDVTVPDIRQFAQREEDDGTFTAFVSLEIGGESAVARVRTGFAGNAIRVFWPADWLSGALSLSASDIANGEYGELTIRQVVVIEGRHGHQALEVMLSDLGDQVNDAIWDIHPGRNANVSPTNQDMSAKRSGAAIPAAWVDIDSWYLPHGEPFRTVLDEEMSLADFLTNEILWRTGGYVHVNSSGQIAWKRFDPVSPRASVDTLTLESETIATSVFTMDDEEGVIGRAVIECNYIIGVGYTRRLTLNFNDLGDIYDVSQAAISLKSRSLWVGAVDPRRAAVTPVTWDTVVGMFDRMRADSQYGGIRASLPLPWRQHVKLRIGERFNLANDVMPDTKGGVGVTQTFEVRGVAREYDEGIHNVEARSVRRGWQVAPSAFIETYSALAITLDVTDDEADLFDSAPARDFAGDWTVRIYDASDAVPFGVSDVAVINEVTGDAALNLVSWGGSFTPAAGDLMVLEDGAPGDLGALNTGDADVEDFAFGADSSYQLSGGRDGPSWG